MALSPHPRKFTLHVTSIDCDLGSEFTQTGGKDEVEIVFHGKVTPKTKDRIASALRRHELTQTLQLTEHKLI